MSALTTRTERLAADVSSVLPTSFSLESWKGNAFNLELGVFNGSEVLDIADVTSLTCIIRVKGSDYIAMTETVAAVDFDETLNSATWLDGSKQHCTFEFSNTQTNMPMGKDMVEYWMVVTAIMESGAERTIAAGTFTLYNDYNSTAGSPPNNQGTSITLEEADARYAGNQDLAGLVSYTSQTKTDAQKTTARSNIAASVALDWTDRGALLPDQTGVINVSQANTVIDMAGGVIDVTSTDGGTPKPGSIVGLVGPGDVTAFDDDGVTTATFTLDADDRMVLAYMGSPQGWTPLEGGVLTRTNYDSTKKAAMRSAIGAAEQGYLFTGGDPTGATSSSQEIQDFLDALPSSPKVVVFPAGSTYLCKDIEIPDNVAIIARGCKFVYGGVTPAGYTNQTGMFSHQGDKNNRSKNIHFIGGHIVGDRELADGITIDPSGGDCLQLFHIDNLIVEEMTLEEWTQDCVEIKQCINVVVRNNLIRNVNDGAIEFRGGSDVWVYNNRVENCRDGFITKRYEAVGGDPEFYGERYHVYENSFQVFSTGINMFWVNNSEFRNNSIIPTSGGTSVTAINVQDHPDPIAKRDNRELGGIKILNNTFYGNTTNTFIRFVTPADAVYIAENEVSGNHITGTCGAGIYLTGWVHARNNTVGVTTAVTDNDGLRVTMAGGDCSLENNHITGAITRITGDAGLTCLVRGGDYDEFVLSAGHIKISDAKLRSCGTPTCASFELVNNKIIESSLTAYVAAVYTNNAIISNNTIKVSGSVSAYAVFQLYGSGTIFTGNVLDIGGGRALVMNSASKDAVISGNRVKSGSTTVDAIEMFGDGHKFMGNSSFGGRECLRVRSTNTDVIANNFRDSTANNVNITNTATLCHYDHNTISGTGTGLINNGPSTTLGTNRP